MADNYILERKNIYIEIRRVENKIDYKLDLLDKERKSLKEKIKAAKEIIKKAEFIRKAAKEAQLSYKVYTKLVLNEKKKLTSLGLRINSQNNKINSLKRKIFRIEVSLTKKSKQKEKLHGSSKPTPRAARKNQD